jgi:hypothetical protein
LEKNTTYYWKVVAQDNKGGTSESPVWRFTTEDVNDPPIVPNSPQPNNEERELN